MITSTSEYMTYCSNQDNAGYSNVKTTINELLEDLDDWKDTEVDYSKYAGRTLLKPGKRHRGEYQYGKS